MRRPEPKGFVANAVPEPTLLDLQPKQCVYSSEYASEATKCTHNKCMPHFWFTLDLGVSTPRCAMP